MSKLLSIDDFDSFNFIKDFKETEVNDAVLKTVKNLDERTQLEPFIRSCIFDLNDTPHGPMEIADILTTKITYQSQKKHGAFILKGKSFKRIKASDISHQIYRLTKIDGIQVAILAYTGSILDQPYEQFISTCRGIKCDYSIWNDYDISRLLISEGFICPKDGSVIEGNVCGCGYNPKRESLNVLQEQAIKELKLAHDVGQQKGLVVLPTGSGKTRVAAADIRQNDFRKALYIAHTYEILADAREEFSKFFEVKKLKIIQKKSGFNSLEKINFVSIQLLSRNIKALNPNSFDYIVVDEFHHAAAKTYLKVLEYFDNEFLLGLTATPFRGDRLDILKLCDGNTIVNYELRDGVELGILSPFSLLWVL